FELSKMIRGMVIFLAVAFYLRSERELRIFVGAIACLICYQGYVALKERVLYAMERVPGTVDDSNSLSVLLLTTMPVMVAAINSRLPRKLKLLAALAIPAGCGAMVLTLSRMGISIMALLLVVSTAVMISWKITPKKIVCAFLVLILGSGVVYKNWAGLKERFGETNMKEEYGNNRELGRGYYLREARAIIEDRFLGVGLNNWSYWVSEKYGPMLGYKFVKYRGTDVEPSDVIPPGSNVDEAQAAPAHSLAALTAGELGIPGLILFTFLWIRWFQMASVFLFKRTPDPLRRIGVGAFFGLSGIFLQSLTEWVFRHSPIFYTVHILLGVLASLYYMHRQQRKALKLRQEGEAPGVSREYRDEGFPASPPAAHPA
ncbi:MAG TPA: O-antigen ligase family protein, partial [Verrucomicrobiae bacterium]|nr:O-antigen ligase family protein [Verrucomicrobiae bacterium]